MESPGSMVVRGSILQSSQMFQQRQNARNDIPNRSGYKRAPPTLPNTSIFMVFGVPYLTREPTVEYLGEIDINNLPGPF